MGNGLRKGDKTLNELEEQRKQERDGFFHIAPDLFDDQLSSPRMSYKVVFLFVFLFLFLFLFLFFLLLFLLLMLLLLLMLFKKKKKNL